MKYGELFSCHGHEFQATINGKECRGKICVEGDIVYLCQNIASGYNGSEEDFGYAYAWALVNKSYSDRPITSVLAEEDVTDFTLLTKEFKNNQPLEYFSNLKVGMIYKYKHFENRRCDKIENGIVCYTKVDSKVKGETPVSEMKEKIDSYVIISQPEESKQNYEWDRPALERDARRVPVEPIPYTKEGLLEIAIIKCPIGSTIISPKSGEEFITQKLPAYSVKSNNIVVSTGFALITLYNADTNTWSKVISSNRIEPIRLSKDEAKSILQNATRDKCDRGSSYEEPKPNNDRYSLKGFVDKHLKSNDPYFPTLTKDFI